MTVGVGDVVRIVAEWDIPDGTIAQLVYHYLGASGTTATDAQVAIAAETALDLAWANVEAKISDTYLGSLLQVLKWDFALNRWDGISSTPMIGIDGTNAVVAVAHGAAGLIKLFTAAARRQARKYVPGISRLEVVGGTIVAATVTDLALFAADLDDDLVAGGLTLEFGTFNSEPTSPLFETFSSASGSVQAEAIVGYQRRRRPGTGI